MSPVLDWVGLRGKFHQVRENAHSELKRDVRAGDIKLSSEATIEVHSKLMTYWKRKHLRVNTEEYIK